MNDLSIVKEVMIKESLAIEKMSQCLTQEIQDCITALYECEGRIIFCGIGKSGHIGKKLAATFASTGSPSFFVHGCEAVHGDLGMIQKKDIVILLSHSGRTAETLSVCKVLKHIGCTCIGMSSNASSELASYCTHMLIYPNIQEADRLHLVPTVSSTMMLALGDAIACVLMEKRKFSEKDFYQRHPGGSLGRQLEVKLYE